MRRTMQCAVKHEARLYPAMVMTTVTKKILEHVNFRSVFVLLVLINKYTNHVLKMCIVYEKSAYIHHLLQHVLTQ